VDVAAAEAMVTDREDLAEEAEVVSVAVAEAAEVVAGSLEVVAACLRTRQDRGRMALDLEIVFDRIVPTLAPA